MDFAKSVEFQRIRIETETSITSLWLKQEHTLPENFPRINKLLFLIIPWGRPVIPAFTTFIRPNITEPETWANKVLYLKEQPRCHTLLRNDQ